MENSFAEIKTELKAINTKLNDAEEKINDLEDRITGISQSGWQIEEQIGKSENNI